MAADIAVMCWYCRKRRADVKVMAGDKLRWVCFEHFEEVGRAKRGAESSRQLRANSENGGPQSGSSRRG
jgi:hypothetical protein